MSYRNFDKMRFNITEDVKKFVLVAVFMAAVMICIVGPFITLYHSQGQQAVNGIPNQAITLSPTEVVSVFYPASAAGTVGASTVLYQHEFGIAVSIPTTSSAGVSTYGRSSILLSPAPAATWVATVYRIPDAGTSAASCSGTPASIGTVSVSTSNIPTWTLTATSFAVGDCIQVVAPGTEDSNAPIPTTIEVMGDK